MAPALSLSVAHSSHPVMNMTNTFDLVVVGDLNADLILQGDVTPVFGQVEKLVDDATLAIGGSSAITACGAARLGLRVAFIGKVGDDDLGSAMIAALQRQQLDTSGVIIDPTLKTGLTVILSRRQDRAMLTYSGSIGALTDADIDWTIVNAARHLHTGSFYLLDGLRPGLPGVFARARRQGLTTSLDTNYDPLEQWADGVRATLAETDIFLPNETELKAIAGLADEEQALALLAGLTGSVAAKLGGAEALFQQDSRSLRLQPPRVNVVDTTGAGDSFNAGFLYGHLHGWLPAQSLAMAVACGAACVQAVGGVSAQPTLAQAEAILHAMGNAGGLPPV